jgi:hypothetical protein
MLMNFDVTDGLSAIRFTGTGGGVGAGAGDFGFHDPDPDPGNDWTPVTGPLGFQAAAGDALRWGTGYTFSFTGGPPVIGNVNVDVGDSGGAVSVQQFRNFLVPSAAEILLLDGFESP